MFVIQMRDTARPLSLVRPTYILSATERKGHPLCCLFHCKIAARMLVNVFVIDFPSV